MGPTVIQMFAHKTGPGAGSVPHAVASPGPGPGIWIWLIVLLVLLAAYVVVRRWCRERTGQGPGFGGFRRAPGSAGAFGLGRNATGPMTAVGAAARAPAGGSLTGAWTLFGTFLKGMGRTGRGASGEILRRVGLSQEGGLRVESRVQLAPGRWLVRVNTGEENLLVTVGPDVHVISSQSGSASTATGGPNLGGVPDRQDAGSSARSATSGDPAGSTFARILGESLSRMGREGPGDPEEEGRGERS